MLYMRHIGRSRFCAAVPGRAPDDRMSDIHPRSTRSLKRDVSADGAASLLRTVMRAVALYLAVGPARSQAAGLGHDGAAAGGQDRHHGGAVHVQMGDRCADRAGQRAARALVLVRLGDRGAGPDDRRLRGDAHPDGGADAGARRLVRQGRHERGAAARLHGVRAHAPALAALPSRAQDRRPHPRARARPQRHRDHRAHGDHAAGADGDRALLHHRGAALSVRLALRGADRRRRSPATWSTPISPPSGASASAAA